MAELISGLRADVIAANLLRLREEIAAAAARSSATRAGRPRGEVELLAATKYVSVEELPVLAEAGVRLVGENRAQELEARQPHPESCSSGTSSASCRAGACD